MVSASKVYSNLEADMVYGIVTLKTDSIKAPTAAEWPLDSLLR